LIIVTRLARLLRYALAHLLRCARAAIRRLTGAITGWPVQPLRPLVLVRYRTRAVFTTGGRALLTRICVLLIPEESAPSF
jgi:hypothetical protein